MIGMPVSQKNHRDFRRMMVKNIQVAFILRARIHNDRPRITISSNDPTIGAL